MTHRAGDLQTPFAAVPHVYPKHTHTHHPKFFAIPKQLVSSPIAKPYGIHMDDIHEILKKMLAKNYAEFMSKRMSLDLVGLYT